MAVYSRPGVYGEENLNPPTPSLGQSTTAAGAFVGISDRGPVTATLVTSWGQYQKVFGGFNTSGASQALPLAVYTCFVNGGREVFVNRVVGSGAVAATRILLDRAGTPLSTLSLTAKNAGAWGNNIYFDVTAGSSSTTFDLAIKYGGSTSAFIVERYSDLSLSQTTGRYCVSVVNSQSAYVVMADLASASAGVLALPALVTAQPLATGANGSAPSSATIATAATTGFDLVTRPLVMNVPGVTGGSDVSTIVNWAEARGDVFVVIDPIDGNQSAQTTATSSYPSSSYGAVYFPYVSVYDPINTVPGTLRRMAPGGCVVGRYLSTDASRGVFKAPAGIDNRVSGALDVDKTTSAERDTLYGGTPAVNVIQNIPGAGICIYGARTLKGGTVDKFVPVRRTLIQIRRALIDLLQFTVFEPNDAVTWRKATNVVSSYLSQFWQQGGLRGSTAASAFFVKCDEKVNTLNSIEAGELRMEVGVALQRPAEFVVFTLSQFDGGAFVTEV